MCVCVCVSRVREGLRQCGASQLASRTFPALGARDVATVPDLLDARLAERVPAPHDDRSIYK